MGGAPGRAGASSPATVRRAQYFGTTKFILSVLALLKCVVGLYGLGLEPPGANPTVPATVYALMLSVFAVAGLGLIFGGHRDRRALDLGAFFLVTASAFSARGLAATVAVAPEAAWTVELFRHLSLEALTPWLLWSFVGRFPKGTLYDQQQTVWQRAHVATAVTGGALLLLQLIILLTPLDGMAPAAVATFYRFGSGTLYWAILLGGQASALAFAAWRSRNVRVEERRRVRLLLGGLLLGSAPLTIVAVAGAISPLFEAWVTSDDGVRALSWVVYPGLMLIPVTSGYAVIVDRALDVRLVVRRAIQYAIARGTAFATIALPSVLLLGVVFRRRDQSISALMVGPEAPVALTLATAAAAAFHWRRPLLDSVDRAFFREQYDSRRTLLDLMVATHHAGDPFSLGALVHRELDRALHLTSSHILVLDRSSDTLIAAGSEVRPIRSQGALVSHLENHTGVRRVEWSDPGAWNRRLPESESAWLADSGARLIMCLRGYQGAPVGLLTIGDKKSELPFTREDRQLVESVGAATALAVDRWLASTTPSRTGSASPDPDRDTHAWDCPVCGRVAAEPGPCRECGTETVPVALPLVIGGQYRLERRIGRGGTGVVYRALDMHLARAVAVKTLPPVGLTHTHRLRREARAVAALSHPGLASIFRYESWEGVPILILEYLEGGTLAERIRTAPLDPAEVLDLGVHLARGLEAMHADGVLHRDVKPSNIGFTGRGEPKLLDLGIAVVMGLGDQGAGERVMGSGTPAYMAPEAIDGQAPTPAFDVWGLTVSLYEAIAGRNPFTAVTPAATMAQIGAGRPPDLRADMTDPPRAMVTFFREALTRDSANRPRSARELISGLESLSENLLIGG